METRGDVLIWGWWERQTNIIINIKLGDADTYTYKFDLIDNLLYLWEKQNDNNHGKNCHEQQKNYPFVLSVDDMLVKEASGGTHEFDSTHVSNKWMNPFCTCMDGLTVRSKSRSQSHTHKWSTELDSPVLCVTGIRTMTRHWSSAWRNKLCAKIIPHKHPRKNSTLVNPPYPSSFAHHARAFHDQKWRQLTVEDGGRISE